MAAVESPTAQKGTSSLAGQVLQYYSDWRTDRLDAQQAWQTSRENFQGGLNELSELFGDDPEWKSRQKKDAWRSDSHINMTKQKVMTAVAIVTENVLQNGQIPFALSPAEWDRLNFLVLPAEITEDIKKSMKEMQMLIGQQFSETHADRELHKVVFSMAEYGEGYNKRIIDTVVRRGWKPQPIPGLDDLTGVPPELLTWRKTTEKLTVTKRIYRSIWNIFRDMENENLQESQGIIDREFVSPFWLKSKMDTKNWINEAIERSIKNNANATNSLSDDDTASLPPHLRKISNRKRSIRYIEFWGRIQKEFVDEFEADLNDNKLNFSNLRTSDIENDGNEEEVVVGVSGADVVFFAKTKPDDRPIDRAVWDINLDETRGQGVADNVKSAQKTLNGSWQTFEDNKKLSGNVILAVKERMIEHMPDEIAPGMKVYVNDEADDVRQAIQPIIIPDAGSGLIDIIRMSEENGDKDSLIPKVAQGFSTVGSETATEVLTRQEASNKYMSGVIRNIDEMLIEPMVQDHLDRNMADPKLKFGKGSYTVKALGTTHFKNRLVRLTKLQQLLQQFLEAPELAKGFDLTLIGEEIARAMDINLDEFRRKPDEITAIEQQQAELEQLQLQAQIAMGQAELAKEQTAAALNQAKAQNEISEAQARIAKLQLDAEELRIEGERLKLEKARLVAELEDKARGVDEET